MVLNKKNCKCGSHIRQAVTWYQRLNRLPHFFEIHFGHCLQKVWRLVFNIIVPCTCRSPKGWFTLYFTFPFRGGKSLFCNIFSCVIKWRCSHRQERLHHVSVPFRRRCWTRKFDVTERVRTGLYRLGSDNMKCFTSPPPHLECLLATSAACFCLQKWMKN